jgi:hypothetical protein
LLQDKDYVWIVDAAGTAQQRDVKMGQQQGSDWVVEEGLKAGDVVVVDGTQKLKTGARVQAQPLATPPAPGTPAAPGAPPPGAAPAATTAPAATAPATAAASGQEPRAT